MSELQKDLERLLERRLKKKSERDRATQPLLPLYAAVTHGYKLAPVAALDPADAGTVIAVATGLRSANAALVPCDKLNPALAKMLDCARLGTLLRDKYCLDLRSLLGDSLLTALDDHVEAFDAKLEEAVEDAAWVRLPSAFDGKPLLDARFGTRTAVRAYLGRTLAGDDAGSKRLVPLLRLVALAVPFGESTSPPHYWFILAG